MFLIRKLILIAHACQTDCVHQEEHGSHGGRKVDLFQFAFILKNITFIFYNIRFEQSKKSQTWSPFHKYKMYNQSNTQSVCVSNTKIQICVYVCILLCVCKCESALSYNCGSILQLKDPKIRAPLIQCTHCTFSRSMIPLCLGCMHYLPLFTSTTYTQKLYRHRSTHNHSIHFFNPPQLLMVLIHC